MFARFIATSSLHYNAITPTFHLYNARSPAVSYCRYRDLIYNFLVGTVPSQIGHLTALEHLYAQTQIAAHGRCGGLAFVIRTTL